MKAKICLAGDLLVAETENGQRFSHADAIALADMLWGHGVKVSEVQMIDWHEDADRAPMGGQKIAILQRLRSHDRSEG